jgi:hypothetical protein
MLYRRDRIYTPTELALRFIAGSLILALYFGLRTDQWSLLLWLWLAYVGLWIVVAVWLRSRGQVSARRARGHS